MSRMLLVISITVLLAGVAAAADPPKPLRRPGLDLQDPNRYPPEMQEMVWLANKAALLIDRLDQEREALEKKYNDADRGYGWSYDRWEWLAAERGLIRAADKASREVAAMERDFWREYNACPFPGKDWLKGPGQRMTRIHQLPLKYRDTWYYIALSHRWRWEPKPPGYSLDYRLFLAGCKGLGLTPDQGRKALVWIDLLATNLLPGDMSQWLTVPMSLMSGPPPTWKDQLRQLLGPGAPMSALPGPPPK